MVQVQAGPPGILPESESRQQPGPGRRPGYRDPEAAPADIRLAANWRTRITQRPPGPPGDQPEAAAAAARLIVTICQRAGGGDCDNRDSC
jgi:hypothetical protein